MIPTKITPTDKLSNSWMDDFFQDSFWPSKSRFSLPTMNIKEEANKFVIELIAPGFDKQDFQLSLEGNNLIVSAQVNKENEEKKENYYKKEYTAQSFKQTFHLPKSNIVNESIDANYSRGILHISIPKAESEIEKAPISIEVK